MNRFHISIGEGLRFRKKRIYALGLKLVKAAGGSLGLRLGSGLRLKRNSFL